jgi:hypothetical protein
MKFIVDEHTSKNIDQLELAYEYIPYTQMTQIKNWKNCKYNFIEYAAIEKEAPNETLEEMSHISWDLLDVIKQKSLSGDEMVIMLVKTSFTNEPETYAIIHQFHEGIWLKKKMNKPGIKKDTPRLNFNREKAMVYKDKLGFTLADLSQLMNLRATNYFGARGTMKAITVERAETLAKAFNCKVEDFTEGTYLDKRQRHEWQRERIKRMRKADKERMKEARKTVSAKPWEEVLPNGVIFIHAPFMETWQSSMTNPDLPNCIYHRDSLGMKRKIIEKQESATIMYLDDWKPIEDIREAFRELREIL